jgi:hypothetical protein
MIEHWGVDVRLNCERVLTIESNCLSGRDLSDEELEAVYQCALHLIGFCGRTAENNELAQLSHNSGSTKSLCLTCKSSDICDSRNYIQTKILACKRYRAQ